MAEYVTITEAARCSGVSTKTIQRAIQAGRLVAHYHQPNRCQIEVSELNTFLHGQLSGHVQVATESRQTDLEQRVQRLEHLVQELLSRQETPKVSRKAKRQESITGMLPKQFVSLLAEASRHNVAESKVLAHVDINLLPARRGEWTDHDGTVVTLALDAKGRQAFYLLYRELPQFTRCGQCPHGYLDSVRTAEGGEKSISLPRQGKDGRKSAK